MQPAPMKVLLPHFDLATMCCPNKDCKCYNTRNLGNISIRCQYGKIKIRNLLYCRTCGKRFSETHNTAFFGLQISDDLIRQIVHHAAEGVSVRATARLLECDKDTVNRVILKAGEHCANVLSDQNVSLEMTEVQLDELWSFTQKKKSSIENEGEHWIWTAIDTKTRLMLSFRVGDRTLDDANRFLRDLTSRLDGKPLFTSDELPHYETVLRDIYCDLVIPERTGMPGRPCGPIKVVHEDLDYATVHKTREDGRVVQVTRQIIFGNEERIQERLANSPSITINTAYVERSNLNWRLWDAHLARKSVTFAKALPWLKAKLAIGISVYNFVRPHESLSRGNDRVFRPKSPAMAAGITQKIWSVLDLLWFRPLCQ